MLEFIGTTIQALALTCGGHYKVLSAQPYFIDHRGTRAPSLAGTTEQIEVLDVDGKDCQKLATSFGIKVQKGDVLPYGVSTGESYEAAAEKAKQRLGQTFAFSTNQQFTYAQADGTLPLFPIVHAESAELLGKAGIADAKALYGTRDLSEFSDTELQQIADETSAISWHDQWLDLLLQLKPQSVEAKKELAHTFVWGFKVVAKTEYFPTLSDGMLIGHALNAMLNELGGTKWQTKLDVWKHQPYLFADQIVSWARFDTPTSKAPLLSPDELEDYLAFALEQSKALKLVSWVDGAAQMLRAFKSSAGSIQKAALPNGWIPPLYVLTPKAQDLVTQLLAL